MNNAKLASTLEQLAKQYANSLLIEAGVNDTNVSTPKNKRTSNTFIVRLNNDNSEQTKSALLAVRTAVQRVNDMFETGKDGFRIRMLKRGRKPVNGANYSYGGSLRLAEAKEIDVYVTAEFN